MNKIKNRLKKIYEKEHEEVYLKLKELVEEYKDNPVIKWKREKWDRKHFSEKDSILITYGDSIVRDGEKPLVSLYNFLSKHIRDKITGVHILPFFPYSSDDGFSIIDYKKVRVDLGGWEDVKKIGEDYRLMADLVVNHVSQKSEWFQGFLIGDEKYKDYFISFEKEVDVSEVFRPRMNPLLTKFETGFGERYVWTTFSRDQIDLNFLNPKVLLEMIDILLFYLSNNIEIIRLDAIGFLWKELGTSCFHHEKTHEIVKLFRDIFEEIAPYAVLITETNVPYKDNISYFGEGDEAHMVYQFSFPPLVLDAFLRQDAGHLKELYKRLESLNKEKLFFNFLASHDGIGVLGGKEFLKEEEFENMLKKVREKEGLVSYKSSKKGEIPYEMNINYFNAVAGGEDIEQFIASQSVIVFSKGVPGIYIHSLLGSKNWSKGVEDALGKEEIENKNNAYRKINREQLDFDVLERELEDNRKGIFERYLMLLKLRGEHGEFNPYLGEEVLECDDRLLVLRRGKVFFTMNVSGDEVELGGFSGFKDLITNEEFEGVIRGYETKFLRE